MKLLLIFICLIGGFSEPTSIQIQETCIEVESSEDFNIDLIRTGLSKVESRSHKDVNPKTGAVGTYQFVPSYHLKDIEEIVPIIGCDDTILEYFRNDSQLQEKFFIRYFHKTAKSITKTDLYFGKLSYLSTNEVFALVHFKGLLGMRDFLNCRDVDLGNNLTAAQYLNKFNGYE